MKAVSTLFLASVVALQAAVDFVPTFDDKPVPAKHAEQIEAALPDGPIVAPEAKRRILVVSATAGFRHASIPTGKFTLEKMGAATGAFETVISDDPANFEPDVLKTFDAVVLLNTTQDFFMPHRRARKHYSEEDLAWVQQVGQGKVFYSSLGHNHHIYWDPMILRHYLAGIQFACGDLEADTTPSAHIQMPNIKMPACCAGH